MIRTVILDAGGVICLPRPGDWLTPVRFEEIIGENRLNSVSPELLYGIKREAANIFLDESLPLADETWEFAARRNYLAEVAKRAGWTLTDREADVLARDFTENDARYDFYDDARSGLDLLGAGHSLGLLSDAMPSLRRIFDNAGLLEKFDAAVLSCEVGATKPDPRMYRAILEKLEADPAECIFVDDRVVNLEGAEACGIRAVHLCREGESAWHGAVAQNLIALARYLDMEGI